MRLVGMFASPYASTRACQISFNDIIKRLFRGLLLIFAFGGTRRQVSGFRISVSGLDTNASARGRVGARYARVKKFRAPFGVMRPSSADCGAARLIGNYFVRWRRVGPSSR